MAGRFNVIDRRKEASILTCAPPPPRSDAATATVAMGRINLHENSPELPTQPRELNKLHASVAPLLAELAEKEKELMEAIRNTEEPPARFVLKSKDPELWEIVDLPLGENAFFDDEKEGHYDVIC